MQGDDRFPNDPSRGEQNEPTSDGDNIPASVAFMEMMREAAARASRQVPPKEPSWTDPALPRSPKPRRRLIDSAPLSPEDTPSLEDAIAAVEAAKHAPEPADDDQPIAPKFPKSAAEALADDSLYDGDDFDAAMQAQRIRRVKRRKTRRRRRTVGMLGGLLRSAIVVVSAAVLIATIFTWWTPPAFIQENIRDELSVAIATSAVVLEPTVLPTPNWLRRIGIVSGHRGPENDPGAVCPDGLTEAELNFNVAQLVVRNLRGRGYTVDLLDEFDPRLDQYQAAALVSIHANTCQDWGERVSGFLIAAAAARVTARGNDNILVECIASHYLTQSGLDRREGLTVDMTDYHTFREIHPLTPAAIIELGFMLADRDIMVNRPDVLARGITDGILCFLEPGTDTEEPPTQEAILPNEPSGYTQPT